MNTVWRLYPSMKVYSQVINTCVYIVCFSVWFVSIKKVWVVTAKHCHDSTLPLMLASYPGSLRWRRKRAWIQLFAHAQINLLISQISEATMTHTILISLLKIGGIINILCSLNELFVAFQEHSVVPTIHLWV